MYFLQIDPETLKNWQTIGFTGALLFAVFALAQGWWYTKTMVEKLLAAKDEQLKLKDEQIELYRIDRDFYKEFHFKQLEVSEKAIHLVERAAN